MDINFNKKTVLSQLQQEFQKRFNFLKIEFFREKKEKDPKYTAADLLDTKLQIGDVSSGLEDVTIHITGLMQVREVEQDFSEKLGLYVQIFRKSGKVWLITSATDHFSLDELDKDAKAKETKLNIEPDKPDYHEQE